MAYARGVQYWYACGCGWEWKLEPDLVPAMHTVGCPRCKGAALAVRRDTAGPAVVVVSTAPVSLLDTLWEIATVLQAAGQETRLDQEV